jgi:hypothetical protein
VATLISLQVRYTDGHGTSEGPLTSAPTTVQSLPGFTVTVTPVDDLLAGSLDGNIVSVSGGIVNTHQVGSEQQALTEMSVALTGGKKPKYGSALKYRWSLPGLSAATTFHVDAFQSANADDNFRFEYSTNNGSTWSALGTINQTTAYQNLTVNGLSVTGNVLVRVLDTDRTAASGNSSPVLDTVTVDHLYFESVREDLQPVVTITAVDATALEDKRGGHGNLSI